MWRNRVERALAQLRAPVEHPFHIVKNLFGHKKLRYRGLAKKTAQLYALFALANPVIVKKPYSGQRRCDDTRIPSQSRKQPRRTQPNHKL